MAPGLRQFCRIETIIEDHRCSGGCRRCSAASAFQAGRCSCCAGSKLSIETLDGRQQLVDINRLPDRAVASSVQLPSIRRGAVSTTGRSASCGSTFWYRNSTAHAS
jgi:hypothetical protein